jgi:hypothetical protein
MYHCVNLIRLFEFYDPPPIDFSLHLSWFVAWWLIKCQSESMGLLRVKNNFTDKKEITTTCLRYVSTRPKCINLIVAISHYTITKETYQVDSAQFCSSHDNRTKKWYPEKCIIRELLYIIITCCTCCTCAQFF